MRVESDKPAEKGGWYHDRDDVSQGIVIPPPKARLTDEQLHARWWPVIERCYEQGFFRLRDLALRLGVSSMPLLSLKVGYSEELGRSPCWTFPQRNATGLYIGICRRLVFPMDDGTTKLHVRGSRSGLTYADGWQDGDGPVFLVEGGSDVSAGMSLGLTCIGRPSNIGGINLLAKMLAGAKRRIVVVGENDQKSRLYLSQVTPPHDPDCYCCPRCAPGRYGMMETARRLSKRIGRSISTIMPFMGQKDLRESYVYAVSTGCTDSLRAYMEEGHARKETLGQVATASQQGVRSHTQGDGVVP